jgi:hypothetical protein
MTTKTLNLPAADNTPKQRSGGATALAVIIATFGALLLLAGVGLFIAQASTDKSDGYYIQDAQLQSKGYAIATNGVALDGGLDGVPSALVGDVRIRATAAQDKGLFVGIARAEDVDRYLRGVKTSRVVDFNDSGEPKYEQAAGSSPATAPARQDFWLEQSEGTGRQQLTWDAKPGDWSVVAMNADASPGLEIDADIGAKFSWLIWVELGLVLVGAVVLAGGIAIWRQRR